MSVVTNKLIDLGRFSKFKELMEGLLTKKDAKATYFNGVTVADATVTMSRPDGSTIPVTVDNVASAGKATNDGNGNSIVDTYETKANAANIYETKEDAATHLTKTEASETYITKADAADTYESKTDAATHLTKTEAADTFATKSEINEKFYTKEQIDIKLEEASGGTGGVPATNEELDELTTEWSFE